MVFGDVFGQHVDYEKGMFYTGRHGLFQANHEQKNDVNKSSSNHLPQVVRKSSIFKPRETSILDSSLPPLSNNNTKGNNNHDNNNNNNIPANKRRSFMNILSFNMNDRKREKEQEIEEFRRNTKTILKTIVIDNPSVHWKREEYGGVKVWVNEKTGEVTTRARPDNSLPATNRSQRLSDERDGASKRLRPNPRNIPSLKRDQSSSTRTVYQNEDMKELMALLNGEISPSMNNSSTKKTIRMKNPLHL